MKNEAKSYYQELNNQALSTLDATNENTNSYYDNLKNESYRAMLNSEIQASNAKDQALKYTNTQLKASGLSGQGVAESTMVGVNNSYQNALANARGTYNAQVNEQAQQRQNAIMQAQQNYDAQVNANNSAYRNEMLQERESTFNTLNDLMANSQSMEGLKSVMKDYGLLDEKGELFLDNANLSDAQKSYVKSVYSDYLNGAKESEWLSENTTNQFSLGNTTTSILENFVDPSGNEYTYKNAIAKLDGDVNASDGTTVRMMSDNGKWYAYLIFHNGNWYMTNKKTYDNSKSQVDINKDGKIK